MSGSRKWYQLDNAAKIVPPTVKGSDTRVFRLTCELYEDVDPEILQKALDQAIQEFPVFRCVLKKGLFWYYLEETGMRGIVQPDREPACAAIYREGRRNLLYRVSYFHRRINLEMFHVLADGTGAFQFLKTILTDYLKIRYNIASVTEQGSDRASSDQKESDAFSKYYKKEHGKTQESRIAPKRAYHLRGERDENMHMHLIEGVVSTKSFLGKAKEHQATVAVFATALYMQAMMQEMSVRERRLPIVLSIPVNLRNYFPSETARNFFGVINVAFWPAHYDGTLDSIIREVNDSFRRQLKEDQIGLTMNSYAALEHNIAVKVVPLLIKDFAISFANGLMQKGITGTVSNVGRISMPPEIVSYIHHFAAFMAAPDAQITITSYGDQMCFGVGTAFQTHPVFMNFFRKMTDLGIEVEIATNDYDVPVPRKKKSRKKQGGRKCSTARNAE